jgi:hypothetical protein
MSTIKSSADHLTLSSDGSGKEVKFQIDGVEKASISSAGAFTSTTIDATKLTGALPAISGANLTGLSSFNPDGAVTINDSGADVDFRVESDGNPYAIFVEGSSNNVGIGHGEPNKAGFQAGSRVLSIKGDAADDFGVLEILSPDTTSGNRIGEIRFGNLDGGSTYASHTGLRATRDGADNSSALSLWTTNAGTFTEKLHITSDGRGLASFTAKAWGKFSQSGSHSFSAQHNCSSISDLGTGESQVNYTNALDNADYAVVSGHAAEADWAENFASIAETTTYCRFLNITDGVTKHDTTRGHFAVFEG